MNIPKKIDGVFECDEIELAPLCHPNCGQREPIPMFVTERHGMATWTKSLGIMLIFKPGKFYRIRVEEVPKKKKAKKKKTFLQRKRAAEKQSLKDNKGREFEA